MQLNFVHARGRALAPAGASGGGAGGGGGGCGGGGGGGGGGGAHTPIYLQITSGPPDPIYLSPREGTPPPHLNEHHPGSAIARTNKIKLHWRESISCIRGRGLFMCC